MGLMAMGLPKISIFLKEQVRNGKQNKLFARDNASPRTVRNPRAPLCPWCLRACASRLCASRSAVPVCASTCVRLCASRPLPAGPRVSAVVVAVPSEGVCGSLPARLAASVCACASACLRVFARLRPVPAPVCASRPARLRLYLYVLSERSFCSIVCCVAKSWYICIPA